MPPRAAHNVHDLVTMNIVDHLFTVVYLLRSGDLLVLVGMRGQLVACLQAVRLQLVFGRLQGPLLLVSLCQRAQLRQRSCKRKNQYVRLLTISIMTCLFAGRRRAVTLARTLGPW
jgi:hypothetical protein